jgi:hypothetical protein
VPADPDRLTPAERLFKGFTAFTGWASKDWATGPNGEEPRGCASPLGALKMVIFLAAILVFPVFVLPLMLVRFARVGWSGLRYGATVEVTSGMAARWSHGTLPPAPAARPGPETIASIEDRDPRFRAATLTSWAAAATPLLRESLVAGDPAPARTFMANGLYRAHQALLEMRARASVSYAGSWRAVSADVVDVTRGALVEQVRVRVGCRGWRWERHEPTGTTLRGGPDENAWPEEFTFARAAGAVTPPGGGLPASRCPSCGAGLDLDPGGACHYCRGVVTAGRHDWVLVSWRSEPW